MSEGKPRGVLIAGNWKMNHGVSETLSFFSGLKDRWTHELSDKTQKAIEVGTVQATAIPPYLSLATALEHKGSLPVSIGAQNAHWKESGAYTGEVSPGMLKEAGIRICLTGHSERRQYFGETDETVRLRTEALLEAGFQVIACIGETKEERESGKTQDVLNRQLSGLFSEGAKAGSYLDGRLVIAYEPVWAIGTGLTATTDQAEEAHQVVRKFIWDLFDMESSGRTPILYGGSVKPDNVDGLLACPNIDGALVGGASLKPESFLALVEAAGRAV